MSEKTVGGASFLTYDWKAVDILHIACHGHFYRSIPEAAHLEFSTEKNLMNQQAYTSLTWQPAILLAYGSSS